MKISVIIPTYDRCDILEMCLKALKEQDFPHRFFEVIVVNDGSRDDTEKVLKRWEKEGGLHLHWFTQPNSGQGAARNRALKKAKGEVVLFLGDDIIPVQDMLKEHWNSHQLYSKRRVAVLGLIEWHPDLELNDYMRWMVNGSSIFGKFGGHQFAYEKLDRGEKPNYNFFYTSNLSLKRKFLPDDPFDLTFSKYGWEDIDLGYRLEKVKKMIMIYNPKAVGHHYHPMDESGMAKRMEMIGRSAYIIHRKHPELKKIPAPWKKLAFHLLSNPVSLWGISLMNRLTGKKLQPLEYYALSKKYFLKGLKSGIIEKI